MKLSPYSSGRLLFIATQYGLSTNRDFVNVFYHYLIHGFDPGSFYLGVLANDFRDVVSSSHVSLTFFHFKPVAIFLDDLGLDGVAYGSYGAIQSWLKSDESSRRLYLERAKLIYTEQEETWITLERGPARPNIDYPETFAYLIRDIECNTI